MATQGRLLPIATAYLSVNSMRRSNKGVRLLESRDDQDVSTVVRQQAQDKCLLGKTHHLRGNDPLRGSLAAAAPSSARGRRGCRDLARLSSSTVVNGESGAGCSLYSLAPRACALLRAVQRGDYENLARLLDRSTSHANDEPGEESVDVRVNTGVLGALLTEACGRDHLDCIELLLQRTCRPRTTAKDKEGYGRARSFQRIEPRRNHPRGRRSTAFPRNDCTPRLLLCQCAIESVELLISAGFSAKSRDDRNCTPLHHAATNGTVQCVSFLSIVAPSTVAARTKGVGDTPLHLAVRSGHYACVEVLLLHGGAALADARNDERDTPVDIATSLGKTACLWALNIRHKNSLTGRNLRRRSRSKDNRNGTAQLHSAAGEEDGGKTDIHRMMAVWERFFENAARACAESLDLGTLTTTCNDHDLSDDYGRPAVGWLTDARCIKQQIEEEASGRVADEHCIKQKVDEEAESLRPCDEYDRGDFVERGSEATERYGWGGDFEGVFVRPPRNNTEGGKPMMRLTAWEIEPARQRQNAGRGGEKKQHGRTAEGKAKTVSTKNEEPSSSKFSSEVFLGSLPAASADVDSGNCADVRFQYQDRKPVWIRRLPCGGSTVKREDMSIANEGDVTDVCSEVDHQSWVACWDNASKSVFYFDSESGYTTWTPPPSAEATLPSVAKVWDPQRGAFFGIDEEGYTRWLGVEYHEAHSATAAPISASRSCVDANDAVLAVERGRDGEEAESATLPGLWTKERHMRPKSDLFYPVQAKTDSPLWSRRTEVTSTSDKYDEFDGNDGEYYAAVEEVELEPSIVPDSVSLEHLNSQPIVEAFFTCRGGVDADDATGFFEAREYASIDDGVTVHSLTSVATTGDVCISVTTVGDRLKQKAAEVERPLLALDSELTRPESSGAGFPDRKKGDEFFDGQAHESVDPVISAQNVPDDGVEYSQKRALEDCTRTCDDGGQSSRPFTAQTSGLPPWMLWCAKDPDSPPYYVNEETGETSWTLPQPRVVVASQGWLKAWSEEHQAYFYANEWNGRVTWDWTDLDDEAVV